MPSSTFNNGFPTILVLFGATGDLAIRKILPALFDLFLDKKLPPLFAVVGFSRRNFTSDQYRDFVRDVVEKYQSKASDADVRAFLARLSFISGRFDNTDDYAHVGRELGLRDGEWKTCANKLFYLAVPPQYYEKILKNVGTEKYDFLFVNRGSSSRNHLTSFSA